MEEFVLILLINDFEIIISVWYGALRRNRISTSTLPMVRTDFYAIRAFCIIS